MRAVKPCVALLVLLTAHAARAEPVATVHRFATDGASQKYTAWRAATVAALVARGDAKSLATAAAISFSGTTAPIQPQALELAARASALAPNDAAIGWLRLRLCVSAVTCDIRAAATELRWLDPENAVAWLPTLAAARRDKDTMEEDRVLADMTQTKRFDVYWNPTVVFMVDALKAAAATLPHRLQTADAPRLEFVAGIAGGEILPSFNSLQETCRELPGAPERRSACLRVAKLMQQSDSTAAQIVGLSIEKRTLPPDSREAHVLGERRHVLEWRNSMAAQFDAPLLPWLKNARARWRLARMRSLGRDEDVNIAILREQGLPLEPPKEMR